MSSLKERFVRFKRWLRGDDVVTGWDKNRSANRLLAILSGRDSLFEERWTTPIIVVILLLTAIFLPILYFNKYSGEVVKSELSKDSKWVEQFATEMKEVLRSKSSLWRKEMLAMGKVSYTKDAMEMCLKSSQKCHEFGFALDQLASSSNMQNAIFLSIGYCKSNQEQCVFVIKLFDSEAFPIELYTVLADIYLPVCLVENRDYDNCNILFNLIAKKANRASFDLYHQRCEQGDLVWCLPTYLVMQQLPELAKETVLAAKIEQYYLNAVQEMTVKNTNGLNSFRRLLPRNR